MARRIHSYLNKSLSTSDGELGSVRDFLFDDHSWGVRYLLVETGSWLTGRVVLISPDALLPGDPEADSLPVNLSEAQVRNAPEVNAGEPVTREDETRLRSYYGWPLYWSDPMYPAMMMGVPFGGVNLGMVVAANVENEADMLDEKNTQTERREPGLRSVEEVNGYHIEATDGEIGHVEDFVISGDDNWMLTHFIIDTRNWLPGRKVVLPVSAILDVDWESRKVAVNLTREAIKDAPEYTSDAELGLHAKVLRDYYKGLH